MSDETNPTNDAPDSDDSPKSAETDPVEALPTEEQGTSDQPVTSSETAPQASAKRVIKIGSQKGEQQKSPEPPQDVGSSAASFGTDDDPDDPDLNADSGKVATPKSSFPPPRVQRISQDLQDEIDAAIGDVSIDDLLSSGESKSSQAAEIELDARYQGTVVKVHRDSIFFSLGANHEGLASSKQFAEIPEPGTQMDVVPTKFIADEGLWELVVPGASVEVADWSDLAEGVVVEATISGHNKGGLECEVNKIRGFIPASQVSLFRVDDLEQFVGQKMLCLVTEANPDRRNLVLSHRAILEREKQEKREETLNQLEVGQTREGTVSKIMDFGAFVDLGGVDGLIHLSQLSWDRIRHPSEVMEEGERVKVRIEKIDSTNGKISLSYRDLLVNPWDAVEAKYPVGAIVKGTVSKIMEFGAFVKLEPGVEGLVHISEIAHHRVHRVNNHVSAGDEVEVKVLSVDENEQKISLSIKAALAVAPNLDEKSKDEPDTQEPARKLIVDEHEGPLKGGLNRPSGGESFGLKW